MPNDMQVLQFSSTENSSWIRNKVGVKEKDEEHELKILAANRICRRCQDIHSPVSGIKVACVRVQGLKYTNVLD